MMPAKTLDVAQTVVAAARGAPLHLMPLDEAEGEGSPPAARLLAGWVRSFLMRPHAELGRPGHVCPFTAQAARLSLLRLAISPLRADPGALLTTMRDALAAFDALPCTPATSVYRTIIVGFPNCTDEAGIAALHKVQNDLRHHSVVRARMIGLFEPNSSAEGLLNPAFRPLRAPVPALAIRLLVAQDAPFVLRNPLLTPIYLAKFRWDGLLRLVRCARTAAATPVAS